MELQYILLINLCKPHSSYGESSMICQTKTIQISTYN